jgi:1-acyl-sn-glycerol-3-phosphate acyltransferase
MFKYLKYIYYYPLKLYIVSANYLYFRKLRVTGLKNIPLKGPLIYAINHQNALLDPLVIHAATWRNPYFLTRGDVFKNKLVDDFLRSIKMLPIYRFRDGFDSIKMNETIFDAAKDILNNGGVVGIFPEGSHSLQYRMRPLKKGVTRIAFLAEKSADFQLNLKIIPIGIQYESHFFSKGRTLVNIGKPIKVADFREEYLANENRGIELLLGRIYDSIKALILHFSDEEAYERNLEIFRQKRIYKRSLVKQLEADQALVDSIEKGIDYTEKSDSKNIIGMILNGTWLLLWRTVSFIPKQCIELLIKKTVKDPHFFGTMRFTYTIFLYPLIFFIMFLLIRFLLNWIS